MAQQSSQQTQYTVVATTESDSDKPPSYFDIIGQIKQITNSEEKSPVKVGQSVYEILCNSVFFGVFLVIASILPVANLVIGILFKNKCTIQPNIPLWLIVIGACGIAVSVARFISNLVFGIKSRSAKEPPTQARCLTCVISLLSIFVFIWFLIGNYWVYSIFSRVQYDQDLFPNDYCHKLCYLFSFWSITATWIMIGLSCLCFCGIFAVAMACVAGVLCFKK